MKLRLEHGKGLDRSQVAGALDGQAVPPVEEYLPDQVEPLLRAIGDQDLLRVYCQPPVLQIPVGQVLPERQETLSGAVLQDAVAAFGEHLDGGLPDLLDGEELGIGQSPGKGDHLGVDRNFEDLPDKGFLHLSHPAREKAVHLDTPSFLLRICSKFLTGAA